MTSLFLVLIAAIVLICIWLNNVSMRIGIPTLLAFILLGIFVGNVGFIPIQLDSQDFARETCTIALIFIMFYGGFGTRWKAVKPVIREAGLLASAGVIATAALTGVFCHLVLGWSLAEGLLIGSVLGSTDAASVFSILRSKRMGLKNNIAPMLEAESGSNDPFAYMMTAVMIAVINGEASAGATVWMLFSQLVFGAGCGLLIAYGASWILQRFNFMTEGFDTLFIFAIAVASYAIPDLMGGNGYLSAYLVGIILGNEDFKGKKAIVGFFDGMTGLMQVLIFFILGLLARPSEMHLAILPALAIFAFMLLAARPLSVMGILAPFRKYKLSQQVFISFVGLRGAASIVFAIMAVTSCTGLNHDLFNIVFCLVLISLLFQGSLIPQAAKLLKVIDPKVNILKTFNDYTEDTDLEFGSIKLEESSPWTGKSIRELGLPAGLMIAMIIRRGVRVVPRGDTVLEAGDEVIFLSHAVNDIGASLIEKRVKPGSRRAGHSLKEYPGDGIVVMIIRDKETMIPTGDTVLHIGDRLVLYRPSALE